MKPIVIYTSSVCPYCTMAKRLLERKGISEWTEINAGVSREVWQEMMTKTGRRTVPQIFIGDVHVGGYGALLGVETIDRSDVT